MILVVDNENGSFSVFHKPEDLGKTEDKLLEMGVLLDEMPIADEVEGMESILRFDGEKLYYEYVKIPPNEIEQLKEAKNLLTSELAKVKIDIMMMKGGAL